MDGILCLEQAICSHSLLKATDDAVVKKVCSFIRIDESPGLINDYIRQQVEAEASMVYLTNKYESLHRRMTQRSNERKAGRFLELGEKNDEGYKWTVQAKEKWILATDAKYQLQLENIAELDGLVSMLRGLSAIVFRRDSKLEQLSINYRQEMRTDKGSSGY